MDLKEKFLALRKEYIDSRFPRLNDRQREAVFHTEGPELIIAGAGSGKTTVITQRIAYMILFGNAYESNEVNGEVTEELVAELEALIQGTITKPSEALIDAMRVRPVSPYNIIAITFTNKAANEMRERLAKQLGDFDARKITASTFHSMCVGQLKLYGHLIGYPRSFTIYDDDDSKSVMKDLLRVKNKPAKDVDAECVLDDISRWKDNMLTPDEAKQAAVDFEEREHAKLYQQYQDRLFKVRAMDFDDLIFNMVRVLTECPKARRKLQSQFTYIMVDEYQDTSVAQSLLVKLLVNDRTLNICAVGDDDQSIYSFRGAEINNILNFPAIFKGCKKIRLEENYRSTGTILNAANSVIAHNTERLGKTLWTSNADGEKVSYADYEDENEEARLVAKKIKQTIQSGVEPKDIAVLFRSNMLTNAIEKALTREKIPYRVIGGTPLFARKAVKDIIAYLTLLVNPADDTRLKRIINKPSRKIGPAAMQKLAETANAYDIPMLEVVKHLESYMELGKYAEPISGFRDVMSHIEEYAEYDLVSLIRQVISCTGYNIYIQEQDDNDKLENQMEALQNAAAEYQEKNGKEATLAGFLEEAALLADPEQNGTAKNAVSVMTVHKAKGLEFDTVFVAELANKFFPVSSCLYSERDLEEERRVFYVAVTRAKRKLYLSSVRRRFNWKKKNDSDNELEPSMFIDEIDSQYVTHEPSSQTVSYTATPAQTRVQFWTMTF